MNAKPMDLRAPELVLQQLLRMAKGRNHTALAYVETMKKKERMILQHLRGQWTHNSCQQETMNGN